MLKTLTLLLFTSSFCFSQQIITLNGHDLKYSSSEPYSKEKLNKENGILRTSENELLRDSIYYDKWENGQWVLDYKYVYNYDQNDFRTSFYHFKFDGTKWVNYEKYEYTNSEIGQILVSQTSLWDTESDTWVPESKREYDYHDNGEVISRTYYNWDTVNVNWHIFRTVETDFDSNGNKILDRSYNYNNELDMLIGFGFNQRIYNENNNLIEHLAYGWDYDLNDWFLFWKGEFDYDYDQLTGYGEYMIRFDRNDEFRFDTRDSLKQNQNHKVIEKITARYDVNSDSWNYTEKNQWTRDNSNGIYLQNIRSTFDDITDEWVYIHKYEQLNNSIDGAIDLSADYSWKDTAWVGNNKYDRLRNDNNDQTYFANYSWNDDSNNWNAYREVISDFDDNEELIGYTYFNIIDSESTPYLRVRIFYNNKLKDQSITFDTIETKTYGDPSFELIAVGGESGNPIQYLSSNSDIATIDGNTVTIVGAGKVEITASQEGNEQYYPAEDEVQTLTIHKAGLTVSADDKLKLIGDELPELTFTYLGFVDDDDANDIDIKPTITTDATKNSAAGSYSIVVSSGSDNNYEFNSYINGILTIESITSLSNHNLNETPRIYPNPVKDQLQISGLIGSYLIKIVDTTGSLVHYGKYAGEQTIRVNNLDRGVYTVLIQAINNQYRQKLIKVN